MAGYIVSQQDVQLFANASRSERFRSTLNSELMPKEGITGGWYHLAAGAANHKDVHDVDEIYFIIQGSAEINLDGEGHRMRAGDTVLVPGGCEHNINNDGGDELVLVYLFCPPPEPGAGGRPSPYQPVEE